MASPSSVLRTADIMTGSCR